MSLLLLGVSLFVTLFSLSTVISLHTPLGFKKIKYDEKPDSPKCLTFTSISFIVVLLVTIIVFNISITMFGDQNMDQIKEETNQIIEKARNLAATNNYFSNLLKVIDKRAGFLSTMRNESHWDQILQHSSSFNQSVSKIDASYKTFKTWVDTGDHGSCGTNHAQMVPFITNIKSVSEKISASIPSVSTLISQTIEKLEKQLSNQTIEQQQLVGIASNTTEDRFINIRVMLAHFHADIDGSETIRQQLIQKKDELSPLLTTKRSVAIVVNVTLVLLIVSILVSLYYIIRPKHSVLYTTFRGRRVLNMVWGVLDLTGLLSFIISIVILLMSQQVMGTSECPLDPATTGLSIFTRQFSFPTGINASLCDQESTTFLARLPPFSLMSTSTLSTPKIEEYRKSMANVMINLTLTIDMSASFSDDLGKLTSLRQGMLNQSESDAKCKVSEVEGFWKLLGECLEEGKRVNDLIGPYNEKIHSKLTNMIEGVDIVSAYQKSINDIQKIFNAIDFSCQPIVDSFHKPAISICEQFEIETFLFPLLWTLFACMITQVLHIEVQRMLVVWRREQYYLDKLSGTTTTTKSTESATKKDKQSSKTK